MIVSSYLPEKTYPGQNYTYYWLSIDYTGYEKRRMLTVVGGKSWYTDPFDNKSNEKSYGTQEKAGNGCVLYSTVGRHSNYTIELWLRSSGSSRGGLWWYLC